MSIDLSQTWHLSGVLLGDAPDWRFDHPFVPYRLSTTGAVHPCVIPDGNLAQHLMNLPLRHHEFLVCPAHGPCEKDTLVVLAAKAKACFNPLVDLWSGICPVEETLPGIVELIAGIQTLPLQQLLQQVFSRRDVTDGFWTMPASRHHHHTYPGGLAQHTFEVASDMAGQTRLTVEERDLGIAGGLLHDIGKVWSYDTDMLPNEASQAMGHVLIGLSKLENQIRTLEAEWAQGAYALRSLMHANPRIRNDGFHPTSLIHRLRAADQRSTERERARTGSPRVWVPKPWQPQGSTDFPVNF